MAVGRPAADTRDRIVAAAAALLRTYGRDAVSTRAVSAAAGVQAPTIYRLFADKHGLLNAVAEHGFHSYLAEHAQMAQSEDPVADLRAGWDQHVGFGLANPYLYSLMYGEPRVGPLPPAVAAARAILAHHVHRIAGAGQLRMSEPRAAQLIWAAGCGTTLTLLADAPSQRDTAMSDLARESVIAAITTGGEPARSGPAAASVALLAALPDLHALTAHERGLLGEWLARIADA